MIILGATGSIGTSTAHAFGDFYQWLLFFQRWLLAEERYLCVLRRQQPRWEAMRRRCVSGKQSFDVVHEVRQSNLHRCPGDPYLNLLCTFRCSAQSSGSAGTYEAHIRGSTCTHRGNFIFCSLNETVFSYGMVTYKTHRPKRHTIPDRSAVQCGEDAGETIIKLWQDYADGRRPHPLSQPPNMPLSELLRVTFARPAPAGPCKPRSSWSIFQLSLYPGANRRRMLRIERIMHSEPGRFLVRRSNPRDLRRFAPAPPLREITKGRTDEWDCEGNDRP